MRNNSGGGVAVFHGQPAPIFTSAGSRKIAGLKINEYGVFRLDENHELPAQVRRCLCRVGFTQSFAPELVRDRHEFRAGAEKDGWPVLIGRSNAVRFCTCNTSGTDGNHTIAQMADAAIQLGLPIIAITDHSKRVTVAGGLECSNGCCNSGGFIDEHSPRVRRTLDDLTKGSNATSLRSRGDGSAG